MDTIQIAAGYGHTVGPKNDGTVIAVGLNSNGQCDVGNWRDVIQIAAGWGHTAGLKKDGTVVAAGDNREGQPGVSDWADIKQVAAGGYHTVGLKKDGTVVVAGPDVELAKWNLGVSEQHALSISSTSGGFVTIPGEGTFNY